MRSAKKLKIKKKRRSLIGAAGGAGRYFFDKCSDRFSFVFFYLLSFLLCDGSVGI